MAEKLSPDYSSTLQLPAKAGDKGSCTGMTKIDYCTEFASIKCSQSSHFLKLKVLPGMNRPTLGTFRHRAATITDCIPELNYPVFTAPWNLCYSLANPLVLAATVEKFAVTGTWSTVPVPCCLAHVPIGVWGKSVGEMKLKYVPHTGLKEKLLSARNLALFFRSNPEMDCLTKNCTLTCAWLGTISIVSSGRDETNPLPYDIVTGLVGPSLFDCLRNACGIIMNYTGLGATVAFSALDSVFAGLQAGMEAGDVFEGLKSGVKTALGYAAGFAIAGVAGKIGAKVMKTSAGVKISAAVTAKMNTLAQTKLSRSLNTLSFKINEGFLSAGRKLGASNSSVVRGGGKVMEWVGRRNMDGIVSRRIEHLTRDRARLLPDQQKWLDASEKLELVAAAIDSDKAILKQLDTDIAALRSELKASNRLSNVIEGRLGKLSQQQRADGQHQEDIVRKMNDIIDEQKKIYSLRDQLNTEHHAGVIEDIDKSLNHNYDKLDHLADEYATITERMSQRRQEMTSMADDLETLGKHIDGKDKELLADMNRRDVVSERLDTLGKAEKPFYEDYVESYDRGVEADTEILKIDQEIDEALALRPAKPEVPDSAEPSKAKVFLEGIAKNIDDGSSGQATTIIDWTTNQAFDNWTIQGAIDGDSEVEAFEIDLSDMQAEDGEEENRGRMK